MGSPRFRSGNSPNVSLAEEVQRLPSLRVTARVDISRERSPWMSIKRATKVAPEASEWDCGKRTFLLACRWWVGLTLLTLARIELAGEGHEVSVGGFHVSLAPWPGGTGAATPFGQLEKIARM